MTVKSGAVHHIALSVSDYEKSKQFYKFLLVDSLGYKITMDMPYCVMYTLDGEHGGGTICISPGNKTPHHKSNPGLHHLALSSATREEVDALHDKVVGFYETHSKANMGRILDEPQAYPQYTPRYYAVFFTDPDGMKLEFAYN